MILHTVAFSLRHEPGSEGERAFIADAMRILGPIPSVQTFEQYRQTSRKNGNDYAFGFSFAFADQAAYDAYDSHPDHVAFVRDRWIPEVSKFIELDYAPV